MRILVTWPGYSPQDAATGARLVAAGHDLILAPKLGARSPDELAALLGDAAAAIVSTDPFTPEVLRAAPHLRVIARVGVGTDSIDRAAADACGVAIAVTPGMNAETVADHALALILALVRKIVVQHELVCAGRWERVGAYTPFELPGSTVGLVGAGVIGKAVIRRLAGFGVHILIYDPLVNDLPGVELVRELDDLLARSDVISLHAPLLEGTRSLINARTLALMKPTAFLVNTSRGGLVDEPALIHALRSGQIAGAGLDVFEAEPLDPARFSGLENVILSPHLAGLSTASLRRMTESATSSVLAVLNGDYPDTIVNRDAIIKNRLTSR